MMIKKALYIMENNKTEVDISLLKLKVEIIERKIEKLERDIFTKLDIIEQKIENKIDAFDEKLDMYKKETENNIQQDMQKIQNKLEIINSLITFASGGWKTLLFLSSLAVGIAAFLKVILDLFK